MTELHHDKRTHREGLRRRSAGARPAWSPRWAALPRNRSPMRSRRWLERDVELARARRSRSIATDRCLQREIEEKCDPDHRAAPADGGRSARDRRRACASRNDLERIGDLAKNIAKRVIALDGEFQPQKLIRGVEHMADLVLGPAQGRARRLCAPRRQPGAGGVARRRGDRRALHFAVPRAPHLHDGRSAQHHVLHASAVLRQEHRAHGRPRTNIAETVYYMVEGRPLTDERPKGDTTTSSRPAHTAANSETGDEQRAS